MARLIAAVIIGLVLGAGTVLLVSGLSGEGESTSPVPRTLETSPDALTTTLTPASRPQIKSLADIQALPSEFERSAALYARLQSADAGTVEILLDEAEGLTNPGRVKQVIYSRYVQLDPRAALDRLRDEERDQGLLIQTTVSALASLDLDAALAFIDTLDKRLQAQSARHILGLDGLSDARKQQVAKQFSLEPYFWRLQASSQAKKDPVGAWQTALAIDMGEERRQALWSIAYTWFETDPSAALSALISIEDAQTGSWQSSLLGRWASQDPDAALQWALAQPASGNRVDPLRQVAGTIAEYSPREMLELAATLEPARRDDVAERVLFAWGRTDPAVALDTLVTMSNSNHLYETVGLAMIDFWANDDPRSAFEWVRSQGPSSIRSLMLSTALANLGRSDPLRALTYAAELDGIGRSTAIEGVLRVWGREDPRAAAAWLDSSEDKTAAAVTAVAQHYANVEPEEAFEWVLDQSAEAQRHAVSMVVGQIAAESPASALRMIDRIRDPVARQAAGSELITAWADTDPQAAIRAISRMDPSMSQNLYRIAFRVWSRFDTEDATAFLDQVPSSNRDGAIQGVLAQTASRDVDLAERLYDRLSGDEARKQAAMTMFLSIREVDPKRAERYRELLGTTGHERIKVFYR